MMILYYNIKIKIFMIIKRDNLDVLNTVDVSDAKVLCLCSVCGKLSDILDNEVLFEDIDCECGGLMELLLIEV